MDRTSKYGQIIEDYKIQGHIDNNFENEVFSFFNKPLIVICNKDYYQENNLYLPFRYLDKKVGFKFKYLLTNAHNNSIAIGANAYTTGHSHAIAIGQSASVSSFNINGI